MSYEIEITDRVIRIVFTGALGRSDITEGIVAIRDAGFGDVMNRLIIDLRDASRLELAVADSHELARTNRSLFDEGPHLRAVVIASGEVRRDVERHYLVRDTLTARNPAQLTSVEIVETLDEARTWLDLDEPD